MSIAMQVDEKVTWGNIKKFLWENPQIFYKGLPLGLLAYLSIPYIFILWAVFPWVWAGYEVYNKVPAGSATVIWGAIQLYLLKK